MAKKKVKPLKKVKKKKLVKKAMPKNINGVDFEDKNTKKTDKYEEHGCEFLNESECEEELDDDGLDVEDVEEEHFEEEKD